MLVAVCWHVAFLLSSSLPRSCTATDAFNQALARAYQLSAVCSESEDRGIWYLVPSCTLRGLIFSVLHIFVYIAMGITKTSCCKGSIAQLLPGKSPA